MSDGSYQTVTNRRRDNNGERRSGQLAAALAKQETRKEERGLTVFVVARGCSTCHWLMKGRTGTSRIPRRSCYWRRAALVEVEDVTGDHPKAKRRRGQMREVKAT